MQDDNGKYFQILPEGLQLAPSESNASAAFVLQRMWSTCEEGTGDTVLTGYDGQEVQVHRCVLSAVSRVFGPNQKR